MCRSFQFAQQTELSKSFCNIVMLKYLSQFLGMVDSMRHVTINRLKGLSLILTKGMLDSFYLF